MAKYIYSKFRALFGCATAWSKQVLSSGRRSTNGAVIDPLPQADSADTVPLEQGSTSVYHTPTRYGGNNYIRLIKVLPGAPNTMISCIFKSVNLDDPWDYTYTALSYTWGDPTPTREILLDGRNFIVRSNLWDFLYQSRDSGRSEFLFTDAISINQADVEERNHQVALMAQIYRTATKVIAWLGRSTHDTEFAMSVVQNLINSRERRNVKKSTQPSSLPHKAALIRLLDHPYWQRLWIQQEIV
ncbi:HET-domain-containing protein, partial [Bimuria novae-zelandiae CBS 107.79]